MFAERSVVVRRYTQTLFTVKLKVFFVWFVTVYKNLTDAFMYVLWCDITCHYMQYEKN
jgi:hypothetical protein